MSKYEIKDEHRVEKGLITKAEKTIPCFTVYNEQGQSEALCASIEEARAYIEWAQDQDTLPSRD